MAEQIETMQMVPKVESLQDLDNQQGTSPFMLMESGLSGTRIALVKTGNDLNFELKNDDVEIGRLQDLNNQQLTLPMKSKFSGTQKPAMMKGKYLDIESKSDNIDMGSLQDLINQQVTLSSLPMESKFNGTQKTPMMKGKDFVIDSNVDDFEVGSLLKLQNKQIASPSLIMKSEFIGTQQTAMINCKDLDIKSRNDNEEKGSLQDLNNQQITSPSLLMESELSGTQKTAKMNDNDLDIESKQDNADIGSLQDLKNQQVTSPSFLMESDFSGTQKTAMMNGKDLDIESENDNVEIGSSLQGLNKQQITSSSFFLESKFSGTNNTAMMKGKNPVIDTGLKTDHVEIESWQDLNNQQITSPSLLMESKFNEPQKIAMLKAMELNIIWGNEDVIGLTAKQHKYRCRMDALLQRSPLKIENISYKKDRTNYPHLMSIIAAPEECPCTKCAYPLIPPRHEIPSRDIFGFQRFKGLNFLQHVTRTQIVPSFPEFTEMVTRVGSFLHRDPERAELIAEAGFFSTGCGKRGTTCFYCGLSLCDELLLDDPWREHARWFPVCPYLQSEKSEQFIHDVIYETNALKTFYKGYNRPSQISIDMVELALKEEYSQIMIQETLQDFLQEIGSYPKPDELFYILEKKKKWKTFDVLD